MGKLYVNYSSYTTSSHQAEEEFGDWEEHRSFDVRGVSLTRSGYDNETFDINTEFNLGDTVYVLWLTYGTGDSFGHSYGNGEIIWVFKNWQLAQEAKKKWEFACDLHGDWRHDNKQQSVTFKSDDGRDIQMSNPVYGYFERLESLNIDSFLIGN